MNTYFRVLGVSARSCKLKRQRRAFQASEVYQILGRNTCSIKSPKGAFDWKGTLLLGLRILFSAIVLNIFAKFVGLSTWYDFLNKPSKVLSWDNYIFLFFVYPFILGLAGRWKQEALKIID